MSVFRFCVFNYGNGGGEIINNFFSEGASAPENLGSCLTGFRKPADVVAVVVVAAAIAFVAVFVFCCCCCCCFCRDILVVKNYSSLKQAPPTGQNNGL